MTSITKYYGISNSIQHSALGIQPVKGVAAREDFSDLQVWSKAHLLVLASYRSTGGFPKQKVYGMTSQIRRCATSIAANIAEECGERGNGEFQRYRNIAADSAGELEYHFLLPRDLNLLPEPTYQQLHGGIVRSQAYAGFSDSQD